MKMNNRKSTDTFASYRLFMLLKFLATKQATVKELVNYLESIDPDNKRYSIITVYKYLNSIKALGFLLEKNEKQKYTIMKYPYSFNFSESSIRALKFLEKYASDTEEDSLNIKLKNFIKEVKTHLNKYSLDTYDKIQIEDINFPQKYTKDKLDLVNKFEQCIKDNLKILISYQEDTKSIKRIISEPIETEYNENDIYLVVYNSTKGQNIFLELEKIIEIEQLPQKSFGNSIITTVMYEIKGRLKNRYVLKKYESLYSSTENTAIILNKGEDKEKLIKRLIGYCDLCKIISPKSYKADMIAELDTIIKNYE